MKITITIFFLSLFWVFLPSTLFVNNKDKVFSHVSPDKEFTTVVYRTKIISPYSFYKFLTNENYYFILYGKNNQVVFKPSFFYGTSSLGASDGIKYIYNEKHYLFYPGVNGYESYEFN
ncbi:hypothetical protein B5M10_10135 [Pluralibacter gergoviae]|uniref:DUF6201 family protein n=1 Tax=Pluralibacter gergoviae TaxID=61647 RepID=UPI0009081A59|nr:DUF6201 family protein [Pluralibacter gergoviae]OUR00953.1 hypothetical protein B5M10_10135 [Pluralibacter gergoviae]